MPLKQALPSPAPPAPSQAPAQIPPLSPKHLADLQTLSSILHLVHHRNRNQHRRSPWYRPFSLFRRHLATLLHHHSSLAEPAVATSTLHRRRRAADRAATAAAIARALPFWHDVLVPRAARAFGQLVADGRFAVLGAVLGAALAQAAARLGVVARLERAAEEEVVAVLARFAREEWGEGGGGRDLLVDDAGERGGEDLGEVVGRGGVEDEDEDEDEDEERNVVEGEDEDVGGSAASDAGMDENAMALEKMAREKSDAGCLAPEMEILRQSREMLRMASPAVSQEARITSSSKPKDAKTSLGRRRELPEVLTPKKTESAKGTTNTEPAQAAAKQKRAAKTTEPASASKQPKKKRKKNAIDELFRGL
ncbi:hypothetical protein MBLNU459_g5281t1 [Dothideomycetes sp. NU459]